MKGYGTTTAPVFAGIKYDLEQLLLKFKQKDSLRLRYFSEVFRALEMSLIFCGRQSAAELVEFSERLLQMAASYIMPIRSYSKTSDMLTEPSIGSMVEHSITERVFGIYACYAFYYLQPIEYVVQIRVTASQMHELTRFLQDVLVPQKHLDTVACLYKLLDDAAFKIVSYDTCFDPVCHKRYDLPDLEEDISEQEAAPFELATSLINDPIMTIEMVHRRYEQGKKDLEANSISVTRLDTIEQLTKTYMEKKSNFEEKQVRLKNCIEKDIDYVTSMSAPGSAPSGLAVPTVKDEDRSKLDIKGKAYNAKIKHSRSRRYADPQMLDNFAALAEIGTLIPPAPADSPSAEPRTKRKCGRKSRASLAIATPTASNAEEVVDTPDASEETAAETASSAPTSTTPGKRGRGRPPKATGSGRVTVRSKIAKVTTEKAALTEAELSAAVIDELAVSFASPTKDTTKSKLTARRPVLDEEFEASMRQFAETPAERAAEKAFSRLVNKKK